MKLFTMLIAILSLGLDFVSAKSDQQLSTLRQRLSFGVADKPLRAAALRLLDSVERAESERSARNMQTVEVRLLVVSAESERVRKVVPAITWDSIEPSITELLDVSYAMVGWPKVFTVKNERAFSVRDSIGVHRRSIPSR